MWNVSSPQPCKQKRASPRHVTDNQALSVIRVHIEGTQSVHYLRNTTPKACIPRLWPAQFRVTRATHHAFKHRSLCSWYLRPQTQQFPNNSRCKSFGVLVSRFPDSPPIFPKVLTSAVLSDIPDSGSGSVVISDFFVGKVTLFYIIKPFLPKRRFTLNVSNGQSNSYPTNRLRLAFGNHCFFQSTKLIPH